MAKRNTNPTRHYYDLSLNRGRSHGQAGKFYEFISHQSWPAHDHTGSLTRIADSSLAPPQFVEWVSNETGISAEDMRAEEITSTSADHDDERDLIERYFKVRL